MSDKREFEKLKALRERLYQRGVDFPPRPRTIQSPEASNVPTSWQLPEKESMETPLNQEQIMATKNKRKAFRIKLILVGLIFFGVSIVLSSLFMLFGGNSISGSNIALDLTGPFTVGGGGDYTFQVGVTNNNSVSIESATLVIEYPAGTQSAEGEGLITERVPLDVVPSGQTVNVSKKVKIFGEENAEQDIKASVEYRVSGSNATFYKEAEPLRYKISSSPVVLLVDHTEDISSGQETEIKLTVTSNSPTKISGLLLKADYPNNFEFVGSTPVPAYGYNTWSIGTLEPEESKTITLKGKFTGSESEERVIHFSVGVPNDRDKQTIASVLNTGEASFTLENPFVSIVTSINGDSDGNVTVNPGGQGNVSISIKNTLPDTIYDGIVQVKVSGNALTASSINVASGFFDSNTGTITWDVSSVSSLGKIAPGATNVFSFSINPNANVSATPQVKISVNFKAKRVSSASAEEELLGTAEAIMKVESKILLRSETSHQSSDTGPIPPKVGESTLYTLTWQVVNGSNDISNAVVTATLPTYVYWTGDTNGQGNWSYIESTRTVMWEVGSIGGNAIRSGSFQVSILPSTSQIGTTPTIVGQQNLRADDDFAGTSVSAGAPQLTTRLSTEAGYSENSGVVESN